jgi:hypothetical protein
MAESFYQRFNGRKEKQVQLTALRGDRVEGLCDVPNNTLRCSSHPRRYHRWRCGTIRQPLFALWEISIPIHPSIRVAPVDFPTFPLSDGGEDSKEV